LFNSNKPRAAAQKPNAEARRARRRGEFANFFLNNFGQNCQVGPPSRLGAVGAILALPDRMAELDEVSGAIINESMRVHRTIGPGLFESVYQQILVDSIQRRGLRVEQNVGISFEYEGRLFRNGFRVDLLVEDIVIVELKSCRPAGARA
jgi:GxxExxY protein